MDFFAEIKDYVGFTDEDSEVLREFLPVARPHFEDASDHFYERILAHDRAHRAITGGKGQIERLKKTLAQWMESGLTGPHDQEFFERRQRIGRVHVDIDLPQRYMLTAMNVMRLDFRRITEIHWASPRERFQRVNDAIDRLFDLELAIMLETYKEDTETRLRRREKLATIGQVAASIGHDLRNPLSVMESSVYILRRRVKEDDRAMSHVAKIQTQIASCDRIITALLEMARDKVAERRPWPIGTVFAQAIEASNLAPTTQTEVEHPEDLEVMLDERLFQLALVNLLINAEQAQSECSNARIRLCADRQDDDVIIEVQDEGPGFASASLPRVFDALTTTTASGTGLGLALVRSIAERHQGTVSGRNGQNGGAIVRIELPNAVSSST